MSTSRQRFLDYVRRVPGARPVVSPFLPKPELVAKTLRYLGLPVGQDDVKNEIRLADWTHERGGLFWYHNLGVPFLAVWTGLW